jgi:flagellar export protein FliJ
MKPRTRLDRLVSLRERGEEEALAALGKAQAQLRDARERLAEAEAAARADGRARGSAAHFELEDAARRRLLQDVRAAAEAAAAAEKQEAAAAHAYRAARREAEAMRRAAERKRGELVAEAGRKERRAVDEIATLRFNRK